MYARGTENTSLIKYNSYNHHSSVELEALGVGSPQIEDIHAKLAEW